MLWHYLIGYGFSILLGQLFIWLLITKLWESHGLTKNGKVNGMPHGKELPIMIGYIERTLYTSSWLLGKPEFIGVWLLLKVAGGWKGWLEGIKVNGNEVLGRTVFSIFLIGSGLCISYAIVGAFLIEWLKDGISVQDFIMPVLLILGTLGFWLWAEILRYKRSKSDSST